MIYTNDTNRQLEGSFAIIMIDSCTIELFHNGKWHPAAVIQLAAKDGEKSGIKAKTIVAYQTDYALDFLDCRASQAISCNFPVNLEIHYLETWPAFLLDILPSGQARRYWIGKLDVADGSNIDWQLLLNGGGHPPGNLRVKEAVLSHKYQGHAGFTREEIISKKESFLEYAIDCGAPVTGSTGAQGDSPKFLLTQDKEGKWHADGALPDSSASKHWIVKFPRGRTEADQIILRNEARYLQVAKMFGVRVAQPLIYDNGALFIPRFDRNVSDSGVKRIAMESLYSLANVSEFGIPLRHEKLCAAIARHCSNPNVELQEYLRRDILNLALKNTDNHGRNQAVCKYEDAQIILSPHYDFAPMFLDPEGIARVCRWEREPSGIPDWDHLKDILVQLGDTSEEEIRIFFNQLAASIGKLPKMLKTAKIDEIILDRTLPGIDVMHKSISKWTPTL